MFTVCGRPLYFALGNSPLDLVETICSGRLKFTALRKSAQKVSVIEQSEIYHSPPLWVVRDTEQLIAPHALYLLFLPPPAG